MKNLFVTLLLTKTKNENVNKTNLLVQLLADVLVAVVVVVVVEFHVESYRVQVVDLVDHTAMDDAVSRGLMAAMDHAVEVRAEAHVGDEADHAGDRSVAWGHHERTAVRIVDGDTVDRVDSPDRQGTEAYHSRAEVVQNSCRMPCEVACDEPVALDVRVVVEAPLLHLEPKLVVPDVKQPQEVVDHSQK
jgi:hypothetical protein